MQILVLFFLVLLCPSLVWLQKTAATNIKVDQVGYLPSAPKIALIDATATGSSPAQNFALKRSSDDAVVFQGKLSAPGHDSNSGDQVQAADFSAVRKSGRYYIDVPGVGRSWNFAIGPRRLFARLLSRDAWFLRTAVRNGRGPGSRISRLHSSRMSREG